MTENEVKSLIALLEDDDEEIKQHVEQKLLSLGHSVIPLLENEWGSVHDQEHQHRIEELIHRIQFSDLLRDLDDWQQHNQHDLLEGIYIISKFRYPDLDKQKIINELDRIRLDIWLELHYDLTSFEKVRIINHVLYSIHGFKGNTDQYHDPQNSFINVVLETKKGNPIMLAVVYMLIAHRLNIPIYGVNLPQHFVLAYKEESFEQQSNDPFNIKLKLDYREGKVLFYINAFNQGSVFSKANLEQFLRQIKIEPRYEFFEACSNIDIVKRVLRNLVVAYEKMNKTQKVREVQEMLNVLGESTPPPYEDSLPDEESDI